MWTNEVIFSEGDLFDVDFYLARLQADGYESPFERMAHVNNMIKRLNAEINTLEKVKESNKLYERFL